MKQPRPNPKLKALLMSLDKEVVADNLIANIQRGQIACILIEQMIGISSEAVRAYRTGDVNGLSDAIARLESIPEMAAEHIDLPGEMLGDLGISLFDDMPE